MQTEPFDRERCARLRNTGELTQEDLAGKIRERDPILRTNGQQVSQWECGHRTPTGHSRVTLEAVLAEIETLILEAGKA